MEHTNSDYPFEIDEISPTYLTDMEPWNQIERLKTELLTILDDA